MVDRSRHDEQQVGEPVDVPDQELVDGRPQRHHPSLGAAADGAREVQRGAWLGTAWQDEVRERREAGLEPIDDLLEALDIGVLQDRLRHAGGNLVVRIGEPGAEREEIALNRRERVGNVRERRAVRVRAERAPRARREQRRERQADQRIELVHFAVRVDPGVALSDARAADERGVAGVTGAGVDFHGRQVGFFII
jgi:hypothetical protein